AYVARRRGRSLTVSNNLAWRFFAVCWWVLKPLHPSSASRMNNHAPLVKIHVHDHTGTIILNRPDKRNARTRETVSQLMQALEDLRCERRVRAVVFSASGTAFCAGMDLNEMQATAAAPNATQLWHTDAVAYRDLVEAMLRLPKPIIAAVGGPAVAG